MMPNPTLYRDLRPAPEMAYEPPSDLIEIIYVDDDILVVSKPEGLLTVPAKYAGHTDCLLARMKVDFPTARVVHRLDMDTSGIMVLSLHDKAMRHLSRQFEQKRAQKTYIADVLGLVADDEGEIDLPLTSDKENLPKQKVCFETGRPSQTHWRVISRGATTTRLELKPKTGRSHQLRVHLMANGHPISGDRFYSEIAEGQGRMMLHAQSLKIRHPADNQFVEFECSCPF